ncbi:MAG: RecQ family ATP-dependent DNA helicase [Bacteroidetes bacterium]|nr:RecQ family ATP-dependent DNA helicase [Bacteroidota bacterium]
MEQKEQDIHSILKKYWGYDKFRPQQKEIILSILHAHDTLALLPTGGGKSICFQVPGLALGGTCLVISPLIALMNDQVQNLRNKGISAVAITSAMNYREIEIALNNAALGHVQFLYISPERLESEKFRQQISYLPITLIAVDEAHCISQWGYDFRPSYLRIAEIRTYFPSVKIIAVTASATRDAIADIQTQLQFTHQNVFRQSFERKNLRYVVQYEENKPERLLRIIQNIGGSGVVYVRNRRKTEEFSRFLNSKNISAGFYHAGIPSQDRAGIQQDWINNKTQVIVATNAFGMGIDKPDVRFVVHLDLPDSLEAYFQEAGRGGRDLKPAYAIALYSKTDTQSLRDNFAESFPDKDTIRQCYQAIYNYYQIPVESGEGLSVNVDLAEICRNYNLKQISLYNSIKFLEKEGYLALFDGGFEPSKVLVLYGKEDIYHFQVKFKNYELLIKTLLRSYGGIFEQYAPVNEKDIAFRIKAPIDLTIKQLQALDTQGVISYIPQTSLPKLVLLQNRLNLKWNELSFKHYATLKEKSLARLESVIHYVEEKNICRSRLLLSYFNETEFQDCGYCDVCVEKNKAGFNEDNLKQKITWALEQRSFTLDELAAILSKYPQKLVLETISTMIDEDLVVINENKSLSLGNVR